MSDKPFWERPLESLNTEEWEQLCDGCGRCCLQKLSDEETGEIFYTRVVCRYFDQQSSRCGCYDSRSEKVPDCLRVRDHDIGTLRWIPDTCAYKLRHEGKPLFDWHPLISGSRDAMEQQGITVAGRAIDERHVHPDGLEEQIITWVSANG